MVQKGTSSSSMSSTGALGSLRAGGLFRSTWEAPSPAPPAAPPLSPVNWKFSNTTPILLIASGVGRSKQSASEFEAHRIRATTVLRRTQTLHNNRPSVADRDQECARRKWDEVQSRDTLILDVDNLKKYYEAQGSSFASMVGLGNKRYVKAVDDVSFEVPRGTTLGIVGESGCGKSTLAKTIIGLERSTGGKADFMGFDITTELSERKLDLITELQMVFQNPDATMNPSYTVGQQISRPLRKQFEERIIILLLLKPMKARFLC